MKEGLLHNERNVLALTALSRIKKRKQRILKIALLLLGIRIQILDAVLGRLTIMNILGRVVTEIGRDLK